MALNRLAREFAAEIANHDWSDAPWRIDRAGHRRERDTRARADDKVLDLDETSRVKTNVAWVVAQVLGHQDPNFNVAEFARQCGVHGLSDLTHENGIRRDVNGNYMPPGQIL